MLINSTDKNEKIVIGLLSYTFTDTTPSIEEIKEIIDEYRLSEHKKIYLYKDADTDNFIGLLAVEMVTNDEQLEPVTINVERLALIPSFREDGYGYQMFEALKEKYPNSTIIGTMGTVDLITEWTRQYNQDY